jgi:hypothetical protein
MLYTGVSNGVGVSSSIILSGLADRGRGGSGGGSPNMETFLVVDTKGFRFGEENDGDFFNGRPNINFKEIAYTVFQSKHI